MRLIDADATLDLLKSLGSRDYRRSKGTIAEAEKMLMHEEYTPTIDAVPMRHGYWEFKDDFGNRNYDFVAVCSRCGKEEKASGYSHSEWRSEWRYCNACGAKMDG